MVSHSPTTNAPYDRRIAPAVLVVAHDSLRAESLAALLDDAHTHVIIAVGGRNALAIASELRPTVVVLELSLLDASASAVVAALKQGLAPHPQIIALERTAHHKVASAVVTSAIDDSIAEIDVPKLLLDRVRRAIDLHALHIDRHDRLTELLILEELGRLHGLDADVKTVLWLVSRQMVGLTGVDLAVIDWSRDERPMWAARDDLGTAVGPRTKAESDADMHLLLSALRRRPAMESVAVSRDELPTRSRAAARRLGLHMLLRLPLTIAHHSNGSLVVGRRDSQVYTERQVARVHHIARLVTAMIERGVLLDDARRRAERLERLQEVIRTVAAASNTDAILRAVTEGTVELLDVDAAQVWTTAGEGAQLQLVAAVGTWPNLSKDPDGVVRRVFRTGRADVQGRGRRGHADRARLAVPLQAGGRPLGVLAVSTGPGLDPAGDAFGVLTVLADNLVMALTNARLDEEAHWAAEQLDKVVRLAAIDRLPTSLVHDMAQTVTTAIGLLEMLVDGETLSPAGQVLVERMHRALSRVGRTPHQAPEGDAPHEATGGIDVRRVVEDVIGLIEHELNMDGIELVRQFESDLPLVAGDADGLARVFVNLLVNARDAMTNRSGRITVIIEASAVAGADQVVVRVRDEGHGISETIRAHMFEPLVTTKELNTGSGLGLAICRQIVEHVGGSIELERVEGQGACVRVVLPAYRSSPSIPRI